MSLWAALRTAVESPNAMRGALRELEAGHGPIAAAKAFAAATSSTTDDAIPAWLVQAARAGVRACDTGIALAAHAVAALEASRPGLVAAARVTQQLAARLADPALPAHVDQAVGQVVDAGYWLVGTRATLRRWMDA